MTIRNERHYDQDKLGASIQAIAKAIVPLSLVTANAGNGADATEDTLASFSIPANTFSALGDGGLQGMWIMARGTIGAAAENTTIKLYFGGQVLTTPTAQTANKNWWLTLEIYRTAASVFSLHGYGQVDTTVVTPFNAVAASVTETAAILAKVTGTSAGSTANNIRCSVFMVEAIEQLKN